MDIKKYLARIGLNEVPQADLESLRLLQESHLYTVPFENLDIHLGRRIIIDYDRIFEKVVDQKRGGFCYELNGLFFHLLEALGYQVKRLSARVYQDERQAFSHEYDHMTLCVHLDGKDWLTDVGFGRFSFAPLCIGMNEIQSDGKRQYKFVPYEADKDYVSVMHLEEDGNWKDGYIFSMKARAAEEFIPMCHYQQTFPESHFLKGKMCTIPTKEGRITLNEKSLKITKAGEVEETEIGNDEVFFQHLKTYFGIAF